MLNGTLLGEVPSGRGFPSIPLNREKGGHFTTWVDSKGPYPVYYEEGKKAHSTSQASFCKEYEGRREVWAISSVVERAPDKGEVTSSSRV